MGNVSDRLSIPELNNLKSTTGLSASELGTWYKEFVREFSGGTITCEEFTNMYKHFYPKGDAMPFAKHVFRSFDSNHDGYLDFREFACGMSVLKKWNLESKLEWAFRVYDIDNNGYISKQEALELFQDIQRMIGITNIKKDFFSHLDVAIDIIFSLMDTNKDGCISLDEFISGAKQDPFIVRILQSEPKSN